MSPFAGDDNTTNKPAVAPHAAESKNSASFQKRQDVVQQLRDLNKTAKQQQEAIIMRGKSKG